MNILEKKIDYIDFNAVPSLIKLGASFCCYVVNFNLSDMATDYPLDKIVKYFDGDIDYADYKEYIEDHGRSYGVDEFFAQDETFLGFSVIETEDTIFVTPLWNTEIADVVYECFKIFSHLALANNKNKPKISAPEESNSISSINTFFRFMPLS